MKRNFLFKTVIAVITASLALSFASCAKADGKDTGNADKYEIEFSQKEYVVVLNDDNSSKIGAEARENGNKINNAELTYTVANPAIAEIAEDGAIISKAEGETAVTASYKGVNASATLKVVASATADQVNSFDEEYVNLYGRTYKRGKSQLCLDHVCTGLDIAINGTYLNASIVSTSEQYICIFVDGKPESIRMQVSPMETNYELVSGLERGYHTVKIAKSSESGDGQIRIGSFESEGFAKIPDNTGLKIEFIGDSITSGYGALGIGGARTVANSDACSSYAYYAASALNANYSMIALQGICVKALYYRQENMIDLYKIISSQNSNEYAFGWNPDVVVVSLGTNDSGYIRSKNSEYAAQFSDDYLELLQYVREKNPNAYILCIYSIMGKTFEVDDGISTAIQAMKDDKIIRVDDYVKFTVNGSGANGHPSYTAQKENGQKLAEYIKTLLAL